MARFWHLLASYSWQADLGMFGFWPWLASYSWQADLGMFGFWPWLASYRSAAGLGMFGTLLDLRTTAWQKREAVPTRARI